MIALETQEAGTGKWFPIIQYAPGTDAQRAQAIENAEVLEKVLGLYVRVIPAAIVSEPSTPEQCEACDLTASECHASKETGAIKCCPDCAHPKGTS